MLGVGGIFFRAENPDALKVWYGEHLRIGAGYAVEDTGPPDEWSWMVQGGPLVFAPFETGTDYCSSKAGWVLVPTFEPMRRRNPANRPR